jgi:thiol-disulfide isomerase/thioredoxin
MTSIIRLAAIIATAILAIWSHHASASTDACRTPPGALGKFSATTERVMTPGAPFLDENEKERALADFRGSGLVVNFWATYCAPCVKEMPALDRLSKAIRKDGIVVLALSADREGVPVVKKFYEKNGLGNLSIAIDKMNKIGRGLGVQALPTTVLFDGDGREIGRVVGSAEWDAPEAIRFLRDCIGPNA